MPQLPGVHFAIVCVPHNQTRAVVELRDLAEDLDVVDRVHFLDPVGPSEVSGFLASADMGIHPMVHFGSHEFALPNKLFEYLHAGLPLAVSDCRALSQFVAANRLGAVFTAEDATSCAAAVRDVLDRKDALSRRIADDGELLAPFDWRRQAENLRDVYRGLVGRERLPECGHHTNLSDVHEVPAYRTNRKPVLGIGPSNSAGQGWQFAKAVEREFGVQSFVLQVDRGSGLGYPADETVPFRIYARNPRWSAAMEQRVDRDWTHAILETGRPIMGHRYGTDFVVDAQAMRANGIRVGLLLHGSEVRNPRAHAERSPWSPFKDPRDELTLALQNAYDVLYPKLETFLAENQGPIFVTTPDLLLDVPEGIWLPVVVEPTPWIAEPLAFDGDRPVVSHIPSRAALKGSAIADHVGEKLAAEGLIEYRRLVGVPSSQMPQLVRETDILLDQFVLGLYGVASVEGMLSGRIVVGHVSEQVRDHVRVVTNQDLPIVEANPDTLEQTLRDLLRDREHGREVARQGQDFASTWHDGRRSAQILAQAMHLPH